MHFLLFRAQLMPLVCHKVAESYHASRVRLQTGPWEICFRVCHVTASGNCFITALLAADFERLTESLTCISARHFFVPLLYIKKPPPTPYSVGRVRFQAGFTRVKVHYARNRRKLYGAIAHGRALNLRIFTAGLSHTRRLRCFPFTLAAC